MCFFLRCLQYPSAVSPIAFDFSCSTRNPNDETIIAVVPHFTASTPALLPLDRRISDSLGETAKDGVYEHF